jgi:hypothetical protein
MDEGLVGRGDQTNVKLPALEVVWFGGAKICDPAGDRGRNHRHGVEGVSQRLLVPRAHPRWPRRQWWRHQGRHEGRVNLLWGKTVGESTGGHPRCPRHWSQQGEGQVHKYCW